MMHWGARIDANDVEFVLAPPRAESAPSIFQSNYMGPHNLWILDFDCCQPLSMDEAGVERACATFYKNDPFYPRPEGETAADKELWNVFRQTFLKNSQVILGNNSGDKILAEKLMERIEEEGKLRRKRKEELAHREEPS